MHNSGISSLLVRKYNKPVPRYTSYPTVPFWKDEIDPAQWQQVFANRFLLQNAAKGISIYVHLPFCESLCTYCGCNKKITTNHKVEEEYLNAIEKEWNLYRNLMKETPVLREIHLGGGTPTFFSPANLKRLMDALLKNSDVHPMHEFSIEGHPNNTTKEHLQLLYSMGFRRISYGVQDTDPAVQRLINRIQPIENVRQATENARDAGFTSVNFDLIYGLPSQTLESIEKTISQVIELKPDRIAFYSYAHVPWTSKAQRLFDEANLPGAEEKLELYMKGKEMLLGNGYYDIGMDHFALPHDGIYNAWKKGELHRNFMGYTTQNSGLLLGLGVSSISDAGHALAQNKKALRDYYTSIDKGELAIQRGYFLTEEDLAFRQYILNVACQGVTSFDAMHLPLLRKYTFAKLDEFESDGLLEYNERSLKLTTTGRYFIRNICSAFDLHMMRANSPADKQIFSKAI